MKTKILTLILLLLLIGPAYAAINSISVVYSNYGTYLFSTDKNSLFTDNFSDGTLPPWSAVLGTWVTSGFKLEGNFAGRSSASVDIIDVNNFTDLNFSTLIHGNNVGDEFYYGISDSSADIGVNGNGYVLFAQTSGAGSQVQLQRNDSGIRTNIISTTATIASGVDQNLLVRKSSGLWRIFLNGSQIGSTSNDSTYTFASHLGASYDGISTSFGGWFDDTNVSVPRIQSQFYVNRLDYDISYNCSAIDANVRLAVNDVNKALHALTCNSSNNTFSSSYTHPTEGPIRVKLWSIDYTNFIQTLFSDQNFISDLNAPTIDINFLASGTGFSGSGATVTANMVCRDAISPKVNYDLNNFTTSASVLNGLFDANTTQSNSVSLGAGENIFIGRCTDIAGNSSLDSNSITASSICFQLVNEQTGANLSTADINNFFAGLTASAYSNGAVYNFKSPLSTSVCYNTIAEDTIRFDLNYSNGLMIYREFNTVLTQNIDPTLNVCIASPQDFFEQLFISSQRTPIIVQNIISECYNLIDYTKYAYQDSLSHRAFTISMPYNLITYIDGNLSLPLVLSIVNGAAESQTQLDVLIFKSQPVNLNLQPDEVGISPYFATPGQTDTNIVQVSYQNLSENNLSVNLRVIDGNVTVFNQTNTATPDSFVTYFDFTGYTINSDTLKLIVTVTKADGSIETLTRYFTLQGGQATFPPIFAAIMAFFFFIFIFTVVGWKSALGIFGIMVTMASLAILALAPSNGWIVILQAVFTIGIIYLGLVYNNTNQQGY